MEIPEIAAIAGSQHASMVDLEKAARWLAHHKSFAGFTFKAHARHSQGSQASQDQKIAERKNLTDEIARLEAVLASRLAHQSRSVEAAPQSQGTKLGNGNVGDVKLVSGSHNAAEIVEPASERRTALDEYFDAACQLKSKNALRSAQASSEAAATEQCARSLESERMEDALLEAVLKRYRPAG